MHRQRQTQTRRTWRPRTASPTGAARSGRHAAPRAIPFTLGTERGRRAMAPETPPRAARIQRSLGVLGSLNIASGVALVAVNAILAQTSHSHPAKKRALKRSSSSNGSGSPLWIGSAVTTAAAVADQARRARS